jgi:hypothetical protein
MRQLLYNARWTVPVLLFLMLVGSSCVIAPQPAPEPVATSPISQPENHQPVINYMTSEQQVLPSSSSRITCVATDSDGDPLVYTWSADKGTIIGNGDTVTWNAPDMPGTYSVTASVTDGKGAEAKSSVTIAVAIKPNGTPTATLIVMEKNQTPVVIGPAAEPITVKRWSTVEIQCKAEDPDGDPLIYKWSATDGKLEGEGARVIYIATTAGDFAITVTVIDSRGAQIKTSCYFHVPCCGQG